MNRRERAMVIAAGAVVLVALAYYFLLRGGEEEAFTIPTPRPRPAPTVSATPSPGAPLPETFEIFEGKDPFQPVISAPPPEPAGGGGGAGGGTGTAPAATGTTQQGRRVELVDIVTDGGQRVAIVRVGGSEYRVKEGDTFADNFRLIDLTSRCGTFVHGDERFTLCIGQEVTK